MSRRDRISMTYPVWLHPWSYDSFEIVVDKMLIGESQTIVKGENPRAEEEDS